MEQNQILYYTYICVCVYDLLYMYVTSLNGWDSTLSRHISSKSTTVIRIREGYRVLTMNNIFREQTRVLVRNVVSRAPTSGFSAEEEMKEKQ